MINYLKKMAIKNQTLIILFFILLFVILSQGVICQPNIGRWPIEKYNHLPITIFHPIWEYKIFVTSTFHITPFSFYEEKIFIKNFWSENGFVENLQSILLFLSIIFIIKYKNIYKKNLLIRIFLIIYLIGLIYYFGEEISWGQHFFRWESSEFFKNYNNQNETNIHNISNLFDQLPRTLVLLWCGIIVPFIMIIQNYIKINKDILKILCPDRKLLIISISLLFFVIPDLLIDKFNLHPGWTDPSGFRLDNFSYLIDMISFNFVRLSELHELIFSYYFFVYSNSFKIKNF